MTKRISLNPTFPGGHVYKWAHMERLGVYRAPEMGVDLQGNPYVMDTAGGPWTWDLRCACGHEWSILEEDFPGKRVLHSCGRAECPFSHPLPAKKKREPKSLRSVNLEDRVIRYLSQCAAQKDVSFSAILNEIVVDRMETDNVNK